MELVRNSLLRLSCRLVLMQKEINMGGKNMAANIKRGYAPVRRAIADGIVTREEIFATHKIMPGNYDCAAQGIDAFS